MGGGILGLAWKRYLQQLDKKPLRTKAITAAVLAGVSDLLAQRLSSRAGAPANWRRTLSIALYGFIWSGPASHYWQQALERLFPNRKDPLRSIKKVVVDQLTYGPLQNVMFMSFLAYVVEGRSGAATRAKLRADFPGVQGRGWRVWPLASYLNQEYVPLQLRVLWLNLVALGWTTFLITRGRTVGAPAVPAWMLRPKLGAA